MASNFKISINRKRDSLYLKLTGDFDGTSACELFNVLKENGNDAYEIVIYTSDLKTIVPFGTDVFRRNFRHLNGLSGRIFFRGENSGRIAPATGDPP